MLTLGLFQDSDLQGVSWDQWSLSPETDCLLQLPQYKEMAWVREVDSHLYLSLAAWSWLSFWSHSGEMRTPLVKACSLAKLL